MVRHEKPDLHCLGKFEFCAGNLNLTTLKMDGKQGTVIGKENISHREVLKDAVSIPSYRRAVMSCEPGARAHLCPGSQDATTGRSQCPRSLRTDGYTIARQLLME
jgi:hypothetical protein